MIGERVSRIIAPSHHAAMSATVRFDTATNEFGRMLLHDFALPWLEDDRPLVFVPAAVLWEERWPRIGVGIDDRDCSTAAQTDRPAWAERGDRARDAVDDRLLTLVQRDFQTVGPGCPNDAAIAQIHSEQVAVGSSLRDREIYRGPHRKRW